jgi:hypothetical protein
VAKRVKDTRGRITAKRLLPGARAAGYAGSPRNVRRVVAGAKAAFRPGERTCWPSVGGEPVMATPAPLAWT